MTQELLSVGYPILIAQTTGYALPAIRISLFTTTTTGWEVANEPTFSSPLAVSPNSFGQFNNLTAGFIRNTTASTYVTLKRN